jgi:uncharacterized protein
MKLRLLIYLLALPLFAVAQNETFKGEHFIEVNGTADQEIEPNEIYVITRLREFEENRNKVALEKLDKEFLEALKEAGIDRKRLELADVGSRLDRFRRKEKEDYREKTYQLKLTSAAELEKYLQKLEGVKVDFVDITKVSHSDIIKIRMELKVKALQAAKSKAEYLLKSIGSEVGKPLMVREWDNDPMPIAKYENVRMQSMDQEMNQQAEPAIAFKKIKLQAQVMAQFQIL